MDNHRVPADGQGSPSVPSGQARRAAALGAVVTRQAARTAATRAAGIGRGDLAREVMRNRDNLRALEQLVDVMGKLKGGAMKAGQMLSVMDLSFLPESHRSEMQAKVSTLCDTAPPAPFKDMRRQIERGVGPLRESFRDFDSNPISSASVGQVYRATLLDGRDVAVKAQYPGIDAAIKSDMRNLRLLGKLLSSQWPTLKDGSIFDELALVLGRELDYSQEAQSQKRAWQRYRHHPFVQIPDVLIEMCTSRVLVTEYVDGLRFSQLCDMGKAERDRIGEIVFRFYVGDALRYGFVSGDPHPGNVLGAKDGRVCFVDFGMYHEMTRSQSSRERALIRASMHNDSEGVKRILAAAGVLDGKCEVTGEQCLAFIQRVSHWHATDAVIGITSEIAMDALLAATSPGRDDVFGDLRRQRLPREHLISRRAELMTFGLLGKLRAEANWHRITREWLFDDDPQTEVGRTEAGWLAAVERQGATPDSRSALMRPPVRPAPASDVTETGGDS